MSPYKYAGVPLTPTVFADLVREMSEGTVVSRSDLVKSVPPDHERRGGLPPRTSAEGVAKKALLDLQRSGDVESVTHGYWRITRSLGADSSDSTATVELGEGEQAVYVYYFPAYRDQAAHLGRTDWPMKIGMTTGDTAIRLRDQCGTAMPEEPVAGLIYRTDDARKAEKMLHAMLTSRGKHLTGAPGKEWFVTSLEEVRNILDFATSGAH